MVPCVRVGRPPAGASKVLLGVAVCGSGGQLQLPVDVIQEVLGLLGVTFHVPFIGSLRVNDSLPGSLAELLRRRDIRMMSGRDVPSWWSLGRGHASDQKHKAGKGGEHAGSNDTHRNFLHTLALILHSPIRPTNPPARVA